MSLRWDRIDAFWFTVMHEFKHIKNGDAYSVDINLVDDGEHGLNVATADDEAERRANAEAAETLVPRAELDTFVATTSPRYSATGIIQFAHQIKMHPGVIVGQLQHMGELSYSAHRGFLGESSEDGHRNSSNRRMGTHASPRWLEQIAVAKKLVKVDIGTARTHGKADNEIAFLVQKYLERHPNCFAEDAQSTLKRFLIGVEVTNFSAQAGRPSYATSPPRDSPPWPAVIRDRKGREVRALIAVPVEKITENGVRRSFSYYPLFDTEAVIIRHGLGLRRGWAYKRVEQIELDRLSYNDYNTLGQMIPTMVSTSMRCWSGTRCRRPIRRQRLMLMKMTRSRTSRPSAPSQPS